MFLETNRPRIRVYLPEASEELIYHRNILLKVLLKAEMEVVFSTQISNYSIHHHLSNVNCSIHILGYKYGEIAPTKQDSSLHEYYFNEATTFSKHKNEDFKIFVWHPNSISKNKFDLKQESFLTSIKNSMIQNVSISYHDSPVVLVEDIHTVMNSISDKSEPVNQTELFFIYNELDEEYAKNAIELLSDVVQIDSFKFSSNSESESSSYLTEQLHQSKMTVVFFRWSSEWANSFTQQLWKMTGGASCETEMLLIGDFGHQSNKTPLFVAPRVTSLAVALELIPLEIKVQYDKLIKNKTV